eukprot:g18520.t1
MDLRFAAEEGDWGDDDEVDVIIHKEVKDVEVIKEIPAKPVNAAPPTPPGSRARASRPASKIHNDPETRYFVMKSSSHKNIVLSVEHQVWATPRNNQEKLNEAFQSASHVILVFSVTGSGCFQGYAKMLSEVGSRSTDVFQGFGRAFDVRWLRLDDLDFSAVSTLRNAAWDRGRPVWRQALMVSFASTQTCAAPVARAPAKEMFDIGDDLEEAVRS